MSLAILFGCKKDGLGIPSTQENNIVSQNYSEESVVFSKIGSNDVITLIPGLLDGQDVPVVYNAARSTDATENQNHLNEVSAFGWTYNGATYNLRSFLRFDNMVLIPKNANVVSATLYLYGLNSAISVPQGNSYYPGSPYFGYGSNECSILRVLSNWDENTLTWNNQPNTTTRNQSIIPASTSQWNYNAEADVTALVKQYVKHPELNFGVCIKQANEAPYHCIVFGSSEQENVNLRPKLVVTYN